MTTSRVALMVIRVWLEESAPHPLRAELRLTTDVSVGFQRTWATAQADEVYEAVRDWLRQVLLSTLSEGEHAPD